MRPNALTLVGLLLSLPLLPGALSRGGEKSQFAFANDKAGRLLDKLLRPGRPVAGAQDALAVRALELARSLRKQPRRSFTNAAAGIDSAARGNATAAGPLTRCPSQDHFVGCWPTRFT